ncbi:hypothetical protein BDF21DRAFT_468866 [Thamnidium elegans]|nr:hypothetical protein BDF21DRAFT_468866 [Thamnidium elegans]
MPGELKSVIESKFHKNNINAPDHTIELDKFIHIALTALKNIMFDVQNDGLCCKNPPLLKINNVLSKQFLEEDSKQTLSTFTVPTGLLASEYVSDFDKLFEIIFMKAMNNLLSTLLSINLASKISKENQRRNAIRSELRNIKRYQKKKHIKENYESNLIYKLSVEFPEILRIVNDYALLLITNTEEPHEDDFDIIENELFRMRLRIFIDNGSLINNIKDKLPISIRRDIKLSSLGTVLLQGTQATVAAEESTINSTRVLVNSIETAVVASQSHHEDEDSKLLLTTCIRNIRRTSMTPNVVSFNSNINIDVILRSSVVITSNITDVTGNMNYNLVSSSRTKELMYTASLGITNVTNLSETLATAILDSVNSSETIQSIDTKPSSFKLKLVGMLRKEMLQIFQDLTDSVKLDHQNIEIFAEKAILMKAIKNQNALGNLRSKTKRTAQGAMFNRHQ